MNAGDLAKCTGARIDRATENLPYLEQAMELFCIYTPARQAMFLAEIGHESLGFKYAAEVWGPTLQQLRYERDFNFGWPNSVEQSKDPVFANNRLAYGLGNAAPGEGKRFMGRAWIMVTGHTNYSVLQKQLRLAMPGVDVPDFTQFPKLLEEPLWAAIASGNFWHQHNINTYADAGDIDGASDVINFGRKTETIGDSNGYANRLALFNSAKDVLS